MNRKEALRFLNKNHSNILRILKEFNLRLHPPSHDGFDPNVIVYGDKSLRFVLRFTADNTVDFLQVGVRKVYDPFVPPQYFYMSTGDATVSLDNFRLSITLAGAKAEDFRLQTAKEEMHHSANQSYLEEMEREVTMVKSSQSTVSTPEDTRLRTLFETSVTSINTKRMGTEYLDSLTQLQWQAFLIGAKSNGK